LGPERLDEVLHFSPPPEGLSFLSIQAFSVYLLIRWWASPTGDGGGTSLNGSWRREARTMPARPPGSLSSFITS
jgi:hypothetical protein